MKVLAKITLKLGQLRAFQPSHITPIPFLCKIMSESKQTGEPGQTPPPPASEEEALPVPKDEKGKAKEAAPEIDPKQSAQELQAKLRALFDSNPVWANEARGLSPDKMQDFVTSKLEQMMRNAVG